MGLMLAALVAALGIASVPASAEDLTAWAHSADFHLNTKANGANISGDVADFPLLIRLDSTVFPFDQAQGDGRDIRFTGNDGASLAFQLERWDSVNRRAEIWVRVPLVKGGSDTGFVRMHWGNAAAGTLSDGKAVFTPASGFAGVWHMQGDILKDAAGNAGDGDGTSSAMAAGLIAGARALTGNNQGMLVPNAAALDMGAAITVTAWIRPETWSGDSHYIFQNGAANIQYSLAQDPSSDSLVWTLGGLTQGQILKGPLPAAGSWLFLALTYDGTTSLFFLDGSLVKSQIAAGPILSTGDELCLGCRSAIGKPHNSFKGLLDEVTISGAARSADFIALAYANQRAQQQLVLHPALVDCRSDFGVSADTTIPEGTEFTLQGRANCASGYLWSSLSGPAPRLLDPEVLNLSVTAPRIAKDTFLVYRFTARFGESYRNMDVTIHVKESIPDPDFSLPAVAAWNGRDSLVLLPVFANLKAVKASRDSVIRYAWSLSGQDGQPAGQEADTAWGNGALILRSAPAGGTFTVGLCADNGGSQVCHSTSVAVDLSVGLVRQDRSQVPTGRPYKGRDVAGRWRHQEITGKIIFPFSAQPF